MSDSEDRNCIKFGKHYRVPDVISDKICPTCQNAIYQKRFFDKQEKRLRLESCYRNFIVPDEVMEDLLNQKSSITKADKEKFRKQCGLDDDTIKIRDLTPDGKYKTAIKEILAYFSDEDILCSKVSRDIVSILNNCGIETK